MVLVDESHLPATLYVPGLTEAQFAEFCERYADFRLEYTAEGELLIMPPTDPKTAIQNARIVRQLDVWASTSGRGYVSDSSGGYLLPSGARLAPDAALISRERLDRWPTCPEFVIELVSPVDRRNKVREKMREWIASGAELGWMIDPRDETVTVYRPGSEPEVLTGISELAADGPADGFAIDLRSIWNIWP